MFRKFLLGLVLVATATFGGMAVAAEPTMHEVYQAAQGGRYIEAQSMMDQVLQAHPDSAKAHYVQAELFARQGLLSRAGDALRTAERLQPGLSFAKPEAVEQLRTVIATPRGSFPARAAPAAQPAASTTGVAPWTLLLGGAGLVAFIAFATRFMRQRSAAPMPVPAYAGGQPAGFGRFPSVQPQPYGNYNPAGAPAGIASSAGPGMGAGIMGGLATGAALGAGMVAGQALMHHFTDGDRAVSPAASSGASPAVSEAAYDTGGQDFGIADNGSWDDGGAVGGDDWT